MANGDFLPLKYWSVHSPNCRRGFSPFSISYESIAFESCILRSFAAIHDHEVLLDTPESRECCVDFISRHGTVQVENPNRKWRFACARQMFSWWRKQRSFVGILLTVLRISAKFEVDQCDSIKAAGKFHLCILRNLLPLWSNAEVRLKIYHRRMFLKRLEQYSFLFRNENKWEEKIRHLFSCLCS